MVDRTPDGDEQLAYQRSVLEAVVETCPDGILVVDDEREFFTYNRQFVEMWEIPEEIVESGDDEEALASVLDRLERPDEFLETVEYFYDNPQRRGRDRIRLADGRLFERYTAPATNAEGSYYGRVWFFQDVTDAVERQRELERQNERLEKFTRIVSHDLHNPLQVAAGRLELALETTESEHLEAVARSVERMQKLVDDLLAVAREGEAARNPESVCLSRIVEQCWESVGDRSATLEPRVEGRIRADPSSLRQLLENLLHNAVEHGGPDVSVTVGTLEDGFYVEDDGPGIPPEERERVFEAGYSTAQEGTGFGLTIVTEIVESHGWDLAVVDGANGGARIEIRSVERV